LALEAAVRQVMSDVPYMNILSGGLNSLLLAVAKNMLNVLNR
jgi:asparagine synthetase B (glutamine-hydrolysing)